MVTKELAERRAAFERSWPVWEPRTFYDHLQHCARLWQDHTWIVVEGTPWTYSQIAELSTRVASALHRHGIRKGDRVALLLGNSAEFFALQVGVTRIGAIAVPVNFLLASGEMRHILDDSEPSALVFDREIAGRDIIEVLDGAGAFAGDAGRPTPILRAETVPPDHSWTTLAQYLSVGEDAVGDVAVEPTDPCAIMYTTGSSGTPKGVLLHSDALLREAYGTALTRGHFAGWSTLTALPPFHLFSLVQAVLPVTFVGGSVTMQTRFDPREQLDIVGAGLANDIVGVAAMFYRIVEEMQTFDRDAHPKWALQSVFLGGDALPEADWQQIRDTLNVDEITAGFGMTELQGTSFMAPPDSSNEVLAHSVGWEKTAGCAGIPHLGGLEHEWRLVDPQTGEVVPQGTVGEVHYRGPSVSPQYWGVAVEDDPSRVDGWFRSKDLGLVRPDGTFVFIGRNSDVFRSGGELVSPAEVESVIARLPDVSAAYVVGVPDRRFGHVGCAWVIPAGETEPDPKAVAEHCRRELARYKVPKYVFAIQLHELPVSASGKFLRRGLVDRAEGRIADTTTSHAS